VEGICKCQIHYGVSLFILNAFDFYIIYYVQLFFIPSSLEVSNLNCTKIDQTRSSFFKINNGLKKLKLFIIDYNTIYYIFELLLLP